MADGEELGAALAKEPATLGRSGAERRSLALIGVAIAAGMAVARFLDWRGHAHPRD